MYRVWTGMMSRCRNKKLDTWVNYGGRGIKVCKYWYKYENFKKDMENSYDENLTLDRIDNNDGYYKDNCRWVSRKIQQNNTRRCRKITYKGITKNISQWAEIIGIHRNTLDYRLLKWGICDKTFTI